MIGRRVGAQVCRACATTIREGTRRIHIVRLRQRQLRGHLAGSQASLYCVTGDEPFQRVEAVDLIRARLRALGFAARQTFTVQPGFDWSLFDGACRNRSLFSERSLIELRVPTASPGSQGAQSLAGFRAGEDIALIVELPRVKRESQSSAWFRRLETEGVLIEVWPLSEPELKAWIDERLRMRGVKLDAGAAELLAQRVEGNLLAAAQEIEKLAVLNEGNVDAEKLANVLADSARYRLDQLVEAAFAGRLDRAVRVLNGLRSEAVEPTLVLWVLWKAVCNLAMPGGSGPRSSGYRRVQGPAAQRRESPGRIRELIEQCARIDRLNKGLAAGRAWDELLELVASLSGSPLLAASPFRTSGFK
jgi:DNA polymerase III subunit delta